MKPYLLPLLLLATPATGAATPNKLQGHFIDTSGKIIGDAVVTQHGGMPMLMIRVRGLTPGKHGLHIHPIGKCNIPDFSEAGKHWNPLGVQHGKHNPMGAHMGDLPNLIVNAKGQGKLSLMLDGISMTGANPLMDADGFAVIIHANEDDYTADPSGNSGTKIACAAFAPSMGEMHGDHM